MIIDIVGWHNKKNVGDEAFKLGFETIFQKHKLNYCTPPEIADRGDAVVLGGGAVVSPFYLESIPKDERQLYAIGISLEYESEADLLKSRKFKAVFIRDDSDSHVLKRKLHCPVISMPDMAFFHRCYNNIVNEPKKIAILLTDYINPAIDRPYEKFGHIAFDFHKKMAQTCDELIHKGWKITFVPCSTGGYGDDRRAAMDVMSFMKNYDQVTNILDTLTPEETIEIISQQELTISMRFHAHIFSIIAGTPFVSIGNTRKVNLLLQNNDLEKTCAGWVDNDVFHGKNLMETIDNVLENSSHYRKKFHSISENNYKKLAEITRTIQKQLIV
jgi:polysaccharide pyruvyl transferase WcaK-like protein